MLDSWARCYTLTESLSNSTYVLIYTNEHNSGGNPAMDNHPKGVLGEVEVEVEILLVASVHALETGDRWWPDTKWSTILNYRLYLLRFTAYT